MLTKTMTYEDFNGVERTEEYCFNLTKAEIMEMELSTEGGFAERVDRIVKAKDVPSIVKIFKELILESYGVKSADGRRFMKSEELRTAFKETPAYSDLFMELSTNDVAAAEFINGIIPADVAKEIAERQKSN